MVRTNRRQLQFPKKKKLAYFGGEMITLWKLLSGVIPDRQKCFLGSKTLLLKIYFVHIHCPCK